MQDRFKFRYYSKKNKKIYDVESIDFNFSRACLKPIVGTESLICKIDLNNLLQCTGLKDKNGELIYEGDIVKLSSGTIGFIVFECQAYAIRFSKKDKYRRVGLGAYQSKELEIIGNIYENPELLGGANG